jgi:hypothetical protein
MPLSKTEVIPELLQECPEFQAAWNDHVAYWHGEPAGDYNDASAIVHELIDSFESGRTDCFPRFFAFVERLILEGDPEVQNLAVVGYLETLQTAASWRDYGPEKFVQWMQPQSRRWWYEIYKWWEGGKSLMDIVRDEVRKSPEPEQ